MTDWIWVGDDPRPLLRSRVRRDVALDTETTGLDYQDEVLGAALAWRDGRGEMKSVYLRAPIGQISIFDATLSRGSIDIHSIIEDLYSTHSMVYHSEHFDHRAIHRALQGGPFPQHQTHDVLHIATLLAYQEEKNLRWLYKKYVGKDLPEGYSDMKGKRGKLKDIPLDRVSLYGRTDAVNTLELKEFIYPKTYAQDEDLYDLERDYALLVMKMIRRGLKLDVDWCKGREAIFRERMVDIEEILYGMGQLRDIGSNHRVAAFLFKTLDLDSIFAPLTTLTNSTFPQGIPSVASDVLDKCIENHPAVRLILEWRQLRGAIGKWIGIGGFRRHAQIDGYIHALLGPFGTISARMAASHPNVQAVPMEDRDAAFGSMQGIFIGDNIKESLWAVDYAQMETRLAAVMARDPKMIKVLNSEEDPYISMSQDMFATRTRRNDAKRGTLASIYGVGVETFATTWNLSEFESRDILGTFRLRYPRMESASILAETMAERDGCVRAYTGRPRWFGEMENKYKAFNQKVQTTVAEILKRAMLHIESALPGVLRLQMHDAVIVNLRAAMSGSLGINESLDIIQDVMIDSVPKKYKDVVPFHTDFKIWQKRKAGGRPKDKNKSNGS